MSKYHGSAKIAFTFNESTYCNEGHSRSYSVSVDCFWGGSSDEETRSILREKGREKLASDVGYSKTDCYSYSAYNSEYQVYKCDE